VNQSDLFAYLVDVLEQLNVPYGIAGAHATIVFGEARQTLDIDVVVHLTRQTLKSFCDAFPYPDFYIADQGAAQAVARGGMFNIIHPESGLKIDVIVPSSAFDRQQLTRTIRAMAFEGKDASFISPEDAIIKKMEYYKEGRSEKHLRDITGIVRVIGNAIDRGYIERWGTDLGLTDIWQRILERLGER
jgi:hypothetical protein